MTPTAKASPLHVALALVAVYVIWGSTYLAILFAIDTLPPFTMAGVRFTIAGGLLYGLMRLRGEPAPTRRQWLAALAVGALLLGVGNGGVTWAEQHVASGTAALILAGTPAWMVLFDWARPGGRRPFRQELLGVGLGLLGIGLLVSGGGELQVSRVDPLGATVVLIASVAWALGSILSGLVPVPRSAMQWTAMQMLTAGMLLLAAGGGSREWAGLDLSAVSAASLLALMYLIVFGSWLAFGAYVWLLRSTAPALASSYAFVNPAIAVLLGWMLAGEALDAQMLASMGVIILGVAMIVLRPRVRTAPVPEVVR